MTRRLIAFLVVAALVAGACGTSEVSAPPTASPSPSAATDWHDESLPPDVRAEALLAEMTIDEKIGQMTQLEKDSVDPAGVTNLLLGSVLSGGGGSPPQNDADGWYAMVDAYQEAALATRLGIPILYGVDAVHGHSNVVGRDDLPAQHRPGRRARPRARRADRPGDRGRDGRHRHPLGLRSRAGRAAGRALGPDLRGLRRGPADRGRSSGARPSAGSRAPS